MPAGVPQGIGGRMGLIETIQYLKSVMAEIDEAIELARRTGTGRAYVGVSGGVMIEVTLDEAIKYLERRKLAIGALIRKLEEEAGGGQTPTTG